MVTARPTARADIVIAVGVFAFSFLVYRLYGFEGALIADDANVIYQGLQFIDGVPPFVSSFDAKGPIAQVLVGLGIWVGDFFALDAIYSARVTACIIGCMTIGFLYLGAMELFGSRFVGLCAALTMLCFLGLTAHVTSGPRYTAIGILFISLNLWSFYRKRWIQAGLFISLAAFTWQPFGMAFLAGIAASFLGGERRKAILLQVVGFLIPAAVIFLYYWKKDATDLLWECLFLNHIEKTAERGGDNLLPYILRPFMAISAFHTGLLAIVGGGAAWLHLLVRESWGRQRPVAAILQSRYLFCWLCIAAFGVFSLIDFQGYPDFFVFLPYLAVGFGQVIDALFRSVKIRWPLNYAVYVAVVVFVALQNLLVLKSRETVVNLADQEKILRQIRDIAGGEVTLYTNKMSYLHIMQRSRQPIPYLFWNGNVDHYIKKSGGYDGVIAALERSAPMVVGLQKMLPDQASLQIRSDRSERHEPLNDIGPEIREWIFARYTQLPVDGGRIYLRNDLAQAFR